MKENQELARILDDLFSEHSNLSCAGQSIIFRDKSRTVNSSNLQLDDKIMISTDILDEILFRFFLDIPQIEMHPIRISFILEEAHWFLIDFFPRYKKVSFYTFSSCILQYVITSEKKYSNENEDLTKRNRSTSCSSKEIVPNDTDFYNLFVSANKPLSISSTIYNLPSMLKNNLAFYIKCFLNYKHSIPVFACLILNETMEYVLLNKGYGKKAQFLFPRGKKAYNETGKEAAIREVYEEIGLDISDKVMDVMFLPKREKYHILLVVNQRMSTPLKTQTRYEIKDIQWVKISDILHHHNKSYGDIDSCDTSLSTNVSSNSYYSKSDLLNVRAVFLKIKKQLDYLRNKRVTINRKKILEHFDSLVDP